MTTRHLTHQRPKTPVAPHGPVVEDRAKLALQQAKLEAVQAKAPAALRAAKQAVTPAKAPKVATAAILKSRLTT
jgi:hypothetical protein